MNLELLFCPYGTGSAFTNPYNKDFRLIALEKTLKTGSDGKESIDPAKSTSAKRKDLILREVLSVTVISAEELPAVDLMGKSDPFVVLTMKKNEQKQKTRVSFSISKLNSTLNSIHV